MTKPLAEIQVEDVRGWANAQDRTRVNPMIGLSCVNNTEEGDHCIAGQWFADHGVIIPEDMNMCGAGDVADLLASELPDNIVEMLKALQIHADTATLSHNGVTSSMILRPDASDYDPAVHNGPWGYAIDEVLGETIIQES